MIDKKMIGNVIKIARSENNITQEQLAEQVGLSTNYLSKVERGLNSTSAETLLKIIEYMNLTLEDFGITKNTDNNIGISKKELIELIIKCDNKTINNILPIIKSIINLIK